MKIFALIAMLLIAFSSANALASTLVLDIIPPTGGTVTSTPAGISCGTNGTGTCTHSFPNTTISTKTVSLTAVADAGYEFDNWGSGVTLNPVSYQLPPGTATIPATATPYFAPLYQLSVNFAGSIGGGVITSSSGGINCPSDPFHGVGGICSAVFKKDTSIILTADIGQSAIMNWVGCDKVNVDGTCTMSMNVPKTVSANVIPTTVTITKTGAGAGSVTSTPSGISCGGTCSAAFTVGSRPSFTAQPDPDSTFTGWGGDFAQSACAKSLTCAVTGDFGLFAPMNITANFEPKQHLTTGFTGSGKGTIISTPAAIDCSNVSTKAIVTSVCGADFDFNSTVTLTATPVSSALIAGWSGCDATPTFDTCTVTMSAAKNVTVNILANTITVQKSGACTGTVTSTPAGIDCGATCSKDFIYGTNPFHLVATADPACIFTGWGGDFAGCGLLTDCSLGKDFGIIYPMTGTANFEMAENILSVSTTGSSATGKVLGNVVINCSTASSQTDICSGPIPRGSKVILEATPDTATNPSTVTWTGCDRESIDVNTNIFTCFIDSMISPTNITAAFNAIHKVVFTSVPGIVLAGSTSQNVVHGGSTSPVSVSSTPTHRSFFRWLTGGLISTDNPIIVNNIILDQTWVATLASHAPTLTYPTLFDAYNNELKFGYVGIRLGAGVTKVSAGADPGFINIGGPTIILGGYDSSYTTQSGLSTVQGAIFVTGGKLVVDGVAIQ